MRYLFTPRPEAAAQMHDHNRYRCDPSQLVSENYLSQFITVQVVSNELYDQCNVFARLSHIDTNMRAFHCLADYGASQSIHAWGGQPSASVGCCSSASRTRSPDTTCGPAQKSRSIVHHAQDHRCASRSSADMISESDNCLYVCWNRYATHYTPARLKVMWSKLMTEALKETVMARGLHLPRPAGLLPSPDTTPIAAHRPICTPIRRRLRESTIERKS